MGEFRGGLQRQSCFAGAGRANQRDHAHVRPARQRADGGQFAFASNQRGGRRRQIAQARPRRAQLRKVARQGRIDHLIEPLRTREVLELVRSQVEAGDAGVVLQQIARRLRQQDLLAVAGRADPGGQMHADADVVIARRRGLAGVDSDAHADALVVGPGLRGQRELRLDGRPDGIARAGERDEERVARRLDLEAGVSRKARAQQAAVLAENFLVALQADGMQEPGRSLDVAEQKRDCAGRGHCDTFGERDIPFVGAKHWHSPRASQLSVGSAPCQGAAERGW